MPDKQLAVLIPVYNDQEGLEISLESLDVEPERFDIVVVDDGSREPIRVSKNYLHPVHLIKLEKNCGIEHALNAGLRYMLSKNYKYIARLDAGDINKSGRIGKELSLLEGCQELGLVGTWVEFIDENDGRHLFTFRAPEFDRGIRKKMKVNTAFVHSSVMFRANLIDRVGNYSSEYKAAEDYELWARMLTITKGQNIQEALVQKAVNLNGISASKRKIQVGNRIKIGIKYFDWGSAWSYIGLLKNAILWLLPLSLTTTIKKLIFK